MNANDIPVADGTAENDVFVLRPIGTPDIEVTRELNANGHMV